MAQVKQIGELDALELNELNAALLQSGYMVVENNHEANIVSIPDLITALGRNIEFNDLETASKEIINAINEINSFVYNYVWIGTTEEYEALETYEDMFYLVTDGGTNYDAVLDNSADDAVVDLETEAAGISAYKMYRAYKLETVTMSTTSTALLEYDTFNECNNLYSVKVYGALAVNEETFRYCIKLYKICPENVNYVGVVSSAPFTSVTLAENPHGEAISYQTVSDYDFENGDLVFNEADSKLYKYDGSSWDVFIPEYGFAGGKNAFENAITLAVLPFGVRDVYGPTVASTYKTASFRKCGLRNIYLDADNFTPHERNSISDNMFAEATSLEKVWIINNGTLSDDISLIFTTIAGGMFYRTTSLKSMTFTDVTYIGANSFSYSGIDKIIAPNVTSIGEPICSDCPNLTEIVLGAITSLPRYFAANSPNLEKVSLGDGTTGLTFTNWNPGMFINCTSLYSLTINTNAVAIAATDERPGFAGSPIVNFLGTTTTAITEGSTVTSIEINGSTVTATNDKITTYGGKDWILTDGAWTEWGTNGNKHPCIKVPSSLIVDYKAHQYWGTFNEELWTAL